MAAAIYGVGIRLDDEPELLFTLRGVDPAELIASVTDEVQPEASGDRKTLAADELADVFGLDLAANPATDKKPARTPPAKRSVAKTAKAVTAPRRKSRRAT